MRAARAGPALRGQRFANEQILRDRLVCREVHIVWAACMFWKAL